MKHTIALVGLAVALFTSVVAREAHAEKKPYTLADLKTLVSQKSFKEAVEHLGDVAPGERTADWLDVAASASAGYIAGLKDDDLVVKVLSIEELDGKFPQILKSPKYTKVRAEVGFDAYEACLGQAYYIDACLQHADKFLEGDPTNAALALKMAKLVRKSAFAYVSVPYWKRALAAAGKAPSAVCKDEDFRLAVIAGLGLPTDYDNAKGAMELANGACWETLKQPILDAWKAEESGYTRTNTCAVLKGKKALSADQLRGCKEK